MMGVLVHILPLTLLASALAGTLPDDCGLQNIKTEASSRIVGGQTTELGEFPWLAALHYKHKSNLLDAGINCGGFIINNRFVLTAAHCLHLEGLTLVVKRDKVWLGVRAISDVDGTDVDKARKFDILNQIPHEQYDAIKVENDIALLKLKRDITFSEYIRPICLPGPNAALPSSGTILTVAGWGKMNRNGGLSDIKRKVDVAMYDHDECFNKLHHAIRSDQFCAEGQENKGTCWGDGGAPFMQSRPVGIDNKWFAIGLVSGLDGCGYQEKPIVHTRVSSYITWIEQQISLP